jgi:serine phosphatase RsbU (regulator of sigma subunit)
VADALASGGFVVARDRTGLVHFAVPLVLGEQPLGALVAGQVFDQYPEQLPLEQVARHLGLAPAPVWQMARREHPVKRATLAVYADLLATLGQTFLQARYHTLIAAERLANMTRLRDHAIAETTRRQRVERAAYERERRIAQVLQRPLLLKVAEDAVPGLRLGTLYAPALDEAEVGGDFLDIFTLPNGHVALVVGDASGKGVEAAAHNTLVKGVLRAFLREDPGHPGSVLGRVNRAVYGTLETLDPADLETFIVVALLVVDPLTGEAIHASAGAEPLLMVRSAGEAEAVARPAPALGMEQRTRYEGTPVRLEPGDTALLVTDGITEARHGSELLGYQGMVQLAQQGLHAPSLQEAGQAILAGARAFARGPLSDDACLILARRR